MSRSSILNFESLEGFSPRFPKTLFWVAILIAALEGALRLIPEEKLMPDKSRQGEIAFIERDVLPKFPAPRIVLLGSSRMRRAVVPRMLDELLELPKNSTINLGLSSGRIFEALWLYERNLPRLSSAKLVVLNIDEWQLSSGWLLGSLYEMHAPWRERLQFADGTGNKLILDGILSMRHKLKLLPNAISRALALHKSGRIELTFDENNQILPPPRKNKPENEAEKYQTEMRAFYDRFEIHPVMESHVEQLARRIAETGGRLVLMQLPNRDAYQALVNREKGREYAQHVAALRALAQRIGVPLLFYEHPSECGLNEESYEDYGHMNPDGAQAFTKFFAKTIKAEKWLEKP